MFNPFSEVLEKTAPTPVKGKEGDENVSTNGNMSTEKGWDRDGTMSPVATKGASMETPKTANRAMRSNSMRKIDSPAPQMASLGRARTVESLNKSRMILCDPTRDGAQSSKKSCEIPLAGPAQ